MKKTAITVLVVLGLIVFVAGIIEINRPTTFWYRVIDNETAVEIRRVRGRAGDIQIPSHLRYLPVTIIGAEAFRFYQHYHGVQRIGRVITSVSIPDTVTHIGRGAFRYNELAYVVIPDSVTHIAEGAFGGSGGRIRSITLGSGVTHIGRNAFSISQLGHVNIPDSVIYLSGFNNAHLAAIDIPYGVRYIGELAFFRNDLRYVIIPGSVVYIGSRAFMGNSLASIIIPDTVTHIGESAFRNNRLTSITIPDSMMYIGERAFANNQLGSVNVPRHTTIANNAFDSGVMVARRN